MATKTKSKSRKSSAKRKASRPKDNQEPGLRKVKADPTPPPMETNESLAPDSTKDTLKFDHPFRAGEEVAFWPFSATGVEQREGVEPMPPPFASCTVLEDGTCNPEGMGKGKWVYGGPAGYPFEERFGEVTIS